MSQVLFNVDYKTFYKQTAKPFLEGPRGSMYIEPYCGLDFRYNSLRKEIHKNASTCACCPLLKKAYKHLETILDEESYKELKNNVEEARLFDITNKERINLDTQDKKLICARWMIFYTMHEIDRQSPFYWDNNKFNCEEKELNYD